MAELARNETGRVGVQGVGSAVTPGINFQPADVSTGIREQARFQSTAAQTIDRLSSMIFGQAERTSQQAGLQFAAENPLTREQLDAMVKGDMSKVNLGSPLNVFDSALRKARAFELSAHAETESTTKLLDVYQRAERGEIDFETVKDQVRAVTDGYSSALAQVDPESSFKYRASLATMGNKIINETAQLEQKKRLLANGIKVQRAYQDFLRVSELYVNGDMPIDPATGEPFDKDTVVDMLATNFLNNAITLVGVNGAAQYQAQILKDLTDVKVNAMTKYIAEEFSADPTAFSRLKANDAGRLTDVWTTMGEDARAKVMQAYFTKIGTENNIKDQQDKASRVERELKAVDLYGQLTRTTDPIKKKDLLRQMSELKVLSFEEINKLARGEADSNPMAMFNALDGIYNGTITSSDQIKRLPIAAKDKITLLNKLHSADRQDDRDLDSGLRRLAGVPVGMQFIDPKGAEFERLSKYQREADVIKQRLISEGKPANSQTILRELSTDVEKRRNSENAKGARNSLKAYEDKAGGEINSRTIDAFEQKVKAGKIKGVKENQLPRIRALVKQAEGDE